MAGGYLPWMGRGVPTLAGEEGYLLWLGGTYLGREGVPTLGGVPTLAGGVPTLAGVPLPRVWTYKQTETITFPYPTHAGGGVKI